MPRGQKRGMIDPIVNINNRGVEKITRMKSIWDFYEDQVFQLLDGINQLKKENQNMPSFNHEQTEWGICEVELLQLMDCIRRLKIKYPNINFN